MKRFAAKLLCMLLALALTLALWVAAILALPDRMQGTIAATMHTKADLLQDTAGQPRIIFAGGSSSPYGTVCRMVEEELGCTAINVGATAYLGLEFYLQLLEQHACEGDVIVLAPERTMLAENGTDYTLVWQAAGNDPDVWAAVPLSYLPGLFCASDDYYRLRRGASDAQADVTYHPDFGPLGDVTLQRETLLASGWDTQDPVRLEHGQGAPHQPLCGKNAGTGRFGLFRLRPAGRRLHPDRRSPDRRLRGRPDRRAGDPGHRDAAAGHPAGGILLRFQQPPHQRRRGGQHPEPDRRPARPLGVGLTRPGQSCKRGVLCSCVPGKGGPQPLRRFAAFMLHPQRSFRQRPKR